MLQYGASLPRWRISSWFFRGEHEDTLFSLSPECCLTRRGGEQLHLRFHELLFEYLIVEDEDRVFLQLGWVNQQSEMQK